MNDENLDPLRELFRSLPELEPPPSLRYKIFEKIQSHRRVPEVWFLKPSLALVSILVVALLGVVTALNFLPQRKELREKSSLLQWAQDSSYIRKGGFSV